MTSPREPWVSGMAASSITTTSATLNALVDPEGDEVTECQFELRGDGRKRIIPCATLPGSGEEEVAVSAAVTGLVENTRYEFAMRVSNAVGTAESENYYPPTVFKTPQALAYGTCRFGELGAKYTEGACQTLSAKTDKGKYRWVQGPAPKCVYVKKHGHYDAGCTTRDEKHGRAKGKYEKAPGPGYTSTMEAVTWETPQLGGLELSCAGASATGEVTTAFTGVERIVFTGCETSGKACASEGPDSTPSGQAGVIDTNLLDTHPTRSATGQVLTQLVSAEHAPYMLEANCEGLRLRISGSLAGVQAGNVNVAASTAASANEILSVG